MTDDEIIKHLRASLHAAVEGADPPADLLTRLRAELAPAHRARPGHPKRPTWQTSRRHFHASLGAVMTSLAVGTTIAVAALAIVLLRHGHASPPTIVVSPAGVPPYVPPNDPAMKYVTAAVSRANRSSACPAPPRPLAGEGSPAISHAAPTQLIRVLSVLRRPATARDKLPSFFAQRNPAANQARVIYSDYIRLARTENGTRYYVIPVVIAWPSGVSVACASASAVALQQELPRIPAALRARARWALAALIAQRRYNSRPHESICELEVDPGGGSGGGTCSPSAWQFAQQGLFISSSSKNGPNIHGGFVPDGVATITVRVRDSRAGRVAAHTARSIDNVVVLQLPHGVSIASRTIVWRDARGNVIKTMKWG